MRAWLVGTGVLGIGLGCSGMPGAAPEPAPVAAPAPAPAPEEPADDGEEDGRASLLPRLPRSGREPRTDCILKIDELEPTLAKMQDGASKPARIRRDEDRLVERVHFDDGTELRVVQGGCAHIGITWEMAPVQGGDDLVGVALAAFGRAKVREKAAWDGVVKKGAKLGDGGSLPCGDATCALTLEGEVLTFRYDFAL